MTADELNEHMTYTGMYRCARRLLLNALPAERVATMLDEDVTKELLKLYDVLACESEEILLVRKEDFDKVCGMITRLHR